MKHFFLACCVLICTTGFTQSLSEANSYFERYEYRRAYETYSKISKTSALPEEDMKKYAYSGFTIGEFDGSYEVFNDLLVVDEIEPFFVYAFAEVCMNLGKFEEAKALYQHYAAHDDEFDVSVKILACDQIPEWQPSVYIINEELQNNTSKADITGSVNDQGVFRFHEVGMDSIGTSVLNNRIDFSELLVNKPYFEGNSGDLHKITFDDSLNYTSISSLAIISGSDDVLLTIAEPLVEDENRMSPHIFTGKWNGSDFSIAEVRPWDYSGLEDTTSCAHATVNQSGNKVVFTKLLKNTENADLYISELINGSWSSPQAMSEINTTFSEMFPVFHGDSMLTFSSDGRPGYGKLDVFSYSFETKEITHFKSPVNGAMDDFNLYFMQGADSAIYTSNRNGGTGDDDRYFIKFRTKEIEIVQPDSSDFFAFADKWFDQKIYFKFDKFNLDTDVEIIDELIAFLKENSNSEISLNAHTDRRGEKDYNLELSEKRAITVKDELISRGINPDQIKLVAKGEEEPPVDCDICTEEMHALNRVVIMKLNAR